LFACNRFLYCRAEAEAFLNEAVKHGAIALDPPPAA
jgi:hypothetical protein